MPKLKVQMNAKFQGSNPDRPLENYLFRHSRESESPDILENTGFLLPQE
jgi:hypothetical protein